MFRNYGSPCHLLLLLLLLATCLLVRADEQKTDQDQTSGTNGKDDQKSQVAEEDEESEKLDPDLEYKKGSLCGYCTYCKFCKLCDVDCPCQRSPTKPNCHMCKYCKYCYLCKLACDTVCQPGGLIDRVSASLFNNLPKFNQADIDKDINAVHDWIEKKKEEL